MSVSGGISKEGRAALSAVLAATGSFITPSDVATVLDVDAITAAKLCARWANNAWLRRVRRGLYISVPIDTRNPQAWTEDAQVIAAVAFDPCYFTGWTAANHWALTEQVFRTTVLKTASRARSTHVRLLEHDYLVAKANDDALSWGLSSEWHDGTRLRFANPARTVIEMLDEPALGGGIRHTAEVLGNYLDTHPADDLVDVGDRLGNRTIFKRLGYLLDALKLETPNLRAECLSRVSAGFGRLDPDAPASGSRNTQWGLLVNVTLSTRDAS